MLKATLTVIAAALLFNCGGSGDADVSRLYFENSELNVTTLARTSGDNIVFKWEFKHPGGTDLTEIISFEIPANETVFQQNFEVGATVPIGYTRVCDCPSDTYDITSGVLSGRLINPGEWTIAFNITVRNSAGLFLPLTDEGNYTMGN